MNVSRSRLSRALTRLAVATVVAPVAVLVSAPAASAHSVVYEDWENGTGTWAVGAGGSVDCGVANTGSCSLKLSPVCCAATVTASKAVGAKLDTAVVSFAFRSEDTGGNTDTSFTVVMDSGTVRIHPTEGVNNNVLVESPGFGSNTFATWTGAGSFMTGSLEFDAVAHTVTATMAGGQATISIPPTAGNITGLQIDAVNWGGGPDFHYDTIHVQVPGQCDDGIDNDGDGYTDYPADPGCSSPDDDAEGATCPPVQGVIVCLDAGEPLVSQPVYMVRAVGGTTYHVFGYVDDYRFFTAAGTYTLPCVVVGVNTAANPCALAGGQFFQREATLIDKWVPETTQGNLLATVGVCKAELTATYNGIGVNSAPAVTVC